MIYPDAYKIALKKYNNIQEHCIVADITGEIRRELREIHQVEIMACPKPYEITNLFQEVVSTQRSPEFISEVRKMGNILSGDPVAGRQIKINSHEGIRIDLYIPQKNDYYRQLAIRTGSIDYVLQVLVPAWQGLGWCATQKNSLRLMGESYSKMTGRDSKLQPKKEWFCDKHNPTLPPAWKSEEELFEWLKLTWIPPRKRYVNR